MTATLRDRTPLFQNAEAAQCIIDSLQFFRRNKELALYCFVVMPDHVHFIVRLNEPLTISCFMARFKSYTTHVLGNQPIWQKGFWSEEISNDKFLIQKMNYIHANPVRAGIAGEENDHLWSSAREFDKPDDEWLIDPFR